MQDTDTTPAHIQRLSCNPITSPVVKPTPKMLAAPPLDSSPGIVPTIGELHRYLAKKYCSLTTEQFDMSRNVKQAFCALREVRESFDPIQCSSEDGVTTLLYPCPKQEGADCRNYCTGRYEKKEFRYCEPCFVALRAAKKRQERRSHDKGDRQSSSSHTNLNVLSPGSMEQRCRNLQVTKKRLSRKVSHLMEKVKQNEDIEFDNSLADVQSCVQKALEYALKNGNEAKFVLNSVVTQLLSSQVETTVKLTASEITDFVESVVDNVIHKAKVMSGREKSIRFSAPLLRMALSLWTRSKKGYEELKETSQLILPCSRSMRRLQKKMRVKEGIHPPVYGWFFDEHVSKKQPAVEHGHIIFDEMKLKSGIFWNTADHSLVGFASQDNKVLTIDDDLQQLFRDDNIEAARMDSVEEPAVYVNQFRFRSIKNTIHNSEFFFNNGALTGDELLEQILHVITCYEMVGCRIHGILSDAGGVNARAFKLLRDSAKIGTTAIPGLDLISFKPFRTGVPLRRVGASQSHKRRKPCSVSRQTLWHRRPTAAQCLKKWSKRWFSSISWQALCHMHPLDRY